MEGSQIRTEKAGKSRVISIEKSRLFLRPRPNNKANRSLLVIFRIGLRLKIDLKLYQKKSGPTSNVLKNNNKQ